MKKIFCKNIFNAENLITHLHLIAYHFIFHQQKKTKEKLMLNVCVYFIINKIKLVFCPLKES